jgi:tetratricopeptide (TPR) repeat protein
MHAAFLTCWFGALTLGGGSFQEGVPVPDSAAAVARARDAQAGFERRRLRWLSLDPSGGRGTNCDEILGRMCLNLGEVGDWWPEEDPPDLVEERDRLLTALARAQADASGDAWIRGQRVVYLAEADRWDEALRVARACTTTDPGWCAALAGFALHGAGRYAEAEVAFQEALDAMPAEEASAWRDPEELLDRAARRALDEARRAGSADEDRFLERLWRFSDPLLLVPGNDRFTEHLARRVVVRTREKARNTFGMSWGSDLASLVVRYGWEIGWQRTFPRPGELATQGSVIGHHHPYTRGYVPAGEVLEAPEVSAAAAWNPAARLKARSGYAPAYAPVLLPVRSRVSVVARQDSVVVVAAVELPADTTYHGRHAHPPLPVPHALAGGPEIEGLFLIPLDGGPVRGVQRPAGAGGGMAVTAPSGSYVVSVERWSPSLGRAGRARQGIVARPVLPDVPVLSDLLLSTPGAHDDSLEGILPRLLPGDSVRAGDTLRVSWEVQGLGWRREAVEVEVRLEKEEGGIFRAAGRLLGLVGAPARVDVDWVEPGPDRPGPWFRSLLLTLPDDLPAGPYRLRVQVGIAGREPLTSSRPLDVHR